MRAREGLCTLHLHVGVVARAPSAPLLLRWSLGRAWGRVIDGGGRGGVMGHDPAGGRRAPRRPRSPTVLDDVT